MIKSKSTEKRLAYKPIMFPWALEACEIQQKMHWVPQEIDLLADLAEFELLEPKEKNVLLYVLRFFTQADVEVGRCYLDYYIPVFKAPEIRMMLTAFANMETIHVSGYSYLISSLRLPDKEYSEFLKHKEMLDKYDYMQGFNIDNPQSIALTLAIVSGFVEGFTLFSMFAVLLYFSSCRPEGRKLQGVGQIVSLSIRDEALHCKSIMKLFHVYIEENKNTINKEKLYEDIYANCRKLVEMEIAFINFAFSEGSLSGLSKAQLTEFIYYLADLRLKQLGLNHIYGVSVNPLKYMVENLFKEQSNFFETTPTNYTKGDIENAENAFSDIDSM